MIGIIVGIGFGLAVVTGAVRATAEERPPVYGSEEAIKQMLRTYNMGGVEEPSGQTLVAMQKAPFILHARGGKLIKVPVEKSLLPHDPKAHHQTIDVAMAPNGTVYVNQCSIMCKSTDGGRTWTSHEVSQTALVEGDTAVNATRVMQGGPNNSFQILDDGTFIMPRHGGKDNLEKVVVWASRDEGRTVEKISEIDNPANLPERYPCTMCRLPDGTLLLPIESRLATYAPPPTYVHRSTDGGRTWTGPTGRTTGAGFLGGFCFETMIAPMPSGKLLATIRYHGGVLSHWPLIPRKHLWYKTIFLADSEDEGKTWENLRPLTTVHGQCHGYALGLRDGSVVVTHDHRYPPGMPCGRAMVSYDEGRTWQDEAYYLYFGSFLSGFSQSMELKDGTILTIAAMNDHSPDCSMFDHPGRRCGNCDIFGTTDFRAIRWKLENK